MSRLDEVCWCPTQFQELVRGQPRCARCMLVLEGFKLTGRAKKAERARSKRFFSAEEKVR